MVQTAEADVVGPAVAAKGPHGLLAQELGVLQNAAHSLVVLAALFHGAQGRQQLIGRLAAGLGVALAVQIGLAFLGGHTGLQQFLHGALQLGVDGVVRLQEAVSELGGVLKQGLLPGSTEAALILAVGGAGQAAAVSGSAAGSVGDIHMVAEQLGDHLDVGRLAAACAGGRELIVVARELQALDVLLVDRILLDGDVIHRVVPVAAVGHHGLRADHSQRRILGQAAGDALAAAQAVVGRHLDAVSILVQTCALGLHGLEGLRRGGLLLIRQQERADGGVGTYHGALVALYALVGIPFGQQHGVGTLVVHGGAAGPRAVHGAVLLEQGHRQLVALQPIHGLDQVVQEVGGLVLGSGRILGILPALGDLHLVQGVDALVHGGAVHIHHLPACLDQIGLVDGVLHGLHRHIHGDDVSQLEEGSLQHGVGAVAQAQLQGDVGGVDGIEAGVLLRQLALQGDGQLRVQLVGAPAAVQQERTVLLQLAGHVELLQIRRVVHGHEVRGLHQIGGVDGLVGEAQMALGHAAGLLGVIVEIGLGVLVGGLADDLHGVLVGAHGAVAAHAPQLAGHHMLAAGVDLLIGQRGKGHVVVDADGEAILGLVQQQVIVHRLHHAGGRVFSRQAEAAAHNAVELPARVHQHGFHIQIQGLTSGAGFLGAVQNRHPGHRLRQGFEKILSGKGPEQMHGDHAHLAATSVEVVHRFPQGLGTGAHGHHALRSIDRAVILVRGVVAACQFVDLVHIVGHDARDGVIVAIGCLAALEEGLAGGRGAADAGMLGVQAVAAEGVDLVEVHQRQHLVIVQRVDLLHLVGGTEAVEEVHEGVTCLDGGQMSHHAQIHGLLGAGRGQHGQADGPAGHHIGVVAVDSPHVLGHGTGGDVEHTGHLLTGNAEHRWDHQHQPLGRGVCRGQGACLQGAVAGTCGARLGLHLDNLHRLAEQVLLTLGSPLVHHLRHLGGGGDGIDGRYFRKRIGGIRRSGVAVHNNFM